MEIQSLRQKLIKGCILCPLAVTTLTALHAWALHVATSVCAMWQGFQFALNLSELRFQLSNDDYDGTGLKLLR